MSMLEVEITNNFTVFRENAEIDLKKRYGSIDAKQILEALDEELSALEAAILSLVSTALSLR